MYVVEKIRFWAEWLRRLGRSRGFGIQSPSAYQFVTEILCQRMPYYAYDELLARFPEVDGRQRKLYRLLFRLSNFRQAAQTYVTPQLSEAGREYLLAGNRRTTLGEAAEGCELAVVSASDGDLSRFLEVLPDDGVLILLGLRRKGHLSAFWPVVKACERVGMTFDAYDVGVALLGRNLHRQHYSVNL